VGCAAQSKRPCEAQRNLACSRRVAMQTSFATSIRGCAFAWFVVGGVALADGKPPATLVLSSKPSDPTAIVTSVRDGDPLFVVISVAKGTLADISFKISDDPDIEGYDLPWLRFVVGKAGATSVEYHKCAFALTKAEAMKASITLSLSPGDTRPAGKLDCFLKTVSASGGVWNNEIRMIDAMAPPAPITVDVPDGVSKYKALAVQLAKRLEQGDIKFNAPPDAVDIKDAALTKRARTQAAAVLGTAPKRFFFTDDDWFETRDALDRVVEVHTTAAITYKRSSQCFYEVLSVVKPARGGLRVTRTSTPYEITCDKL
jgi:hypothetical protein